MFDSDDEQWSTSNVFTIGNMSANGTTSVQCTSTHLTSFAVLVDVAGGLKVYKFSLCCICTCMHVFVLKCSHARRV